MLRVADSIYSQGTAENVEDGLIINPPFYGVIDATSAPHSSEMKEILFWGESGGAMVRRIIQATFHNAASTMPLGEAVLRANQRIREIQEAQGIPIVDAGRLAGASFVFLKMEGKTIQVIQGGDCLLVYRYHPAGTTFTPNYAYGHVAKNLQIIKEIMEKNGGDRKAMWVEFAPMLAKFRQQDINNPTSKTGYAMLNGQPTLQQLWKSFIIPGDKNLQTIIAFSDGFVRRYEETRPETLGHLASGLLDRYIDAEISLSEILKAKRIREIRDAETSHIIHEEATALAMKWN